MSRLRRSAALGAVLFAIAAAASARRAFGWGSYGHEQVNGAAVELLSEQGSPLGALFAANKETVQRLGIAPDLEWKNLKTSKNHPLPNDQKFKRCLANATEHPLHYFEVDAFASFSGQEGEAEGAAGRLPHGTYAEAYPAYQAMLQGKKAAAHGTAPWRILQLYDLCVAALREGNAGGALLYCGTMGHYVGDMSQPFHSTLNYNGQNSKRPSTGIHSIFEDFILQDAAKEAYGGKKRAFDEESHIWGLDATDGDVRSLASAAVKGGLSPISRDGIISAMIFLAASGNRYIEPLLASFATQCEAAQSGRIDLGRNHIDPEKPFCMAQKWGEGDEKQHIHARESVWINRAFSGASMQDAGGLSALDVAKRRMADGAVALARLWHAAYLEAGSPRLRTASFSFESLHVIDNYPVPEYLPDLPDPEKLAQRCVNYTCGVGKKKERVLDPKCVEEIAPAVAKAPKKVDYEGIRDKINGMFERAAAAR